jgi:hypothetical protein
VSDAVEQIQPEDPEIDEEWLRQTDEGEIRDVGASRSDAIGGWQVEIYAMANVRDDPLETELRQRITSALQAVRGVSAVQEQDQETWIVTGTPSGKALVEAAAQVTDDLAPRIRAYLSGS